MREWIEGAQAAVADREAFAEVVAHFAPRVRDFLHRSGAAEDAVEDATQAVMRALWADAASRDPRGAGLARRVFGLARGHRAALMGHPDADHRLDPAVAFAPAAPIAGPMPSLAAVEARLQRIQEQLRRARVRQTRQAHGRAA